MVLYVTDVMCTLPNTLFIMALVTFVGRNRSQGLAGATRNKRRYKEARERPRAEDQFGRQLWGQRFERKGRRRVVKLWWRGTAATPFVWQGSSKHALSVTMRTSPPASLRTSSPKSDHNCQSFSPLFPHFHSDPKTLPADDEGPNCMTVADITPHARRG